MAESEQTSNHSEFLRLLAEHEAPIRAFLRAILSSVADADEAFQLLIGICFYKDFYRRIGPAGFEGVQ